MSIYKHIAQDSSQNILLDVGECKIKKNGIKIAKINIKMFQKLLTVHYIQYYGHFKCFQQIKQGLNKYYEIL